MQYITELAQKYNFPEWVIIVTPISLFFMIIFIIVLVVKILEPKYKLYKKDIFHNMVWQWKYKGENIVELWCYCPVCKSMLHVDDENCRTTQNLGDKITFFVCDKCDEREVGRIVGGDRKYALSVIRRAILANIRLNTYDIYKEV
ncbi:hypothetical protein [Sulfurospirillum arcachonense]|uniref:hypothetical protein n=1 Tax=Sulfurospirillum arcachonense TaxID=57666 RepID=UPI000468325F|nr:hypothetical protein [Sulfurospirillum arcachonense]